MNYDVTCELCERRWPMDDPGVRYDPATGTWYCTHEPSCFLRRADTQAEFEQWARDTATQLRNLETRT